MRNNTFQLKLLDQQVDFRSLRKAAWRLGVSFRDKKDSKQFLAKQYLKDLHPRFDFLFYANDLNENRFANIYKALLFKSCGLINPLGIITAFTF